MKKWLAVVLALLLLLGGCTATQEHSAVQTKFYYRNKDIRYGTQDGLIGWEYQETNGDLSLAELLLRHQKGPTKDSLVSPVTTDITILGVDTQDGALVMRLDVSAVRNTDVDFSVDCACMCMTLMDYTGMDTVRLQILRDAGADEESYVICRSDLHLIDDLPIETTSE